MPITASTLVSRAALILQDVTFVRWTQAELLGWLNDGQRESVIYKPEAYTKHAVVALVAGTKQSLPADNNVLISVLRNMGTLGTTPGAAVRVCSRDILDSQVPNWHAAATSSTAANYCYDSRDPDVFYVYPPQPSVSPGQVEIVYGAVPADVAIADPIKLDDIYATALINYILYRAYAKDSEYASNAGAATAYYQTFLSLLTGKTAGDDAAGAAK